MLKTLLTIMIYINCLINVFSKNLLKKIKESLLSTFFLKISFIKVFSFNLNIRVIKLN